MTVKFAQQETERKKRARERSFGYLSQKSAEEPWFHTEFHNSNSEKAEVSSQIVAQKLEAFHIHHLYMPVQPVITIL